MYHVLLMTLQRLQDVWTLFMIIDADALWPCHVTNLVVTF